MLRQCKYKISPEALQISSVLKSFKLSSFRHLDLFLINLSVVKNIFIVKLFEHFSMGTRLCTRQLGKGSVRRCQFFAKQKPIFTSKTAADLLHFTFAAKMVIMKHVVFYFSTVASRTSRTTWDIKYKIHFQPKLNTNYLIDVWLKIISVRWHSAAHVCPLWSRRGDTNTGQWSV